MNTHDRQLDHSRHPFRVAAAQADSDFRALDVDDSKPAGRQLLRTADFGPPGEHLVLHVLDEPRLDETVELCEKRAERFIAFRSDRSFRLELDGRRFEWGAAEQTGLILKQMVGADPECTAVRGPIPAEGRFTAPFLTDRHAEQGSLETGRVADGLH